MNPIVVVHGGGAGPISKDRKERMHQGIVRAATVGYGILREGGSAVDAVEGAVVALEDDPEFNAGCGSVLNTDGEVEMDASIMDGKDLSVGAVSAVRCIANPIKLARLVMEKTPHCFLTDQGAAQFAAAMGVPEIPGEKLVTEKNKKRLEKEKHEKGAQKTDCEKLLKMSISQDFGRIRMLKWSSQKKNEKGSKNLQRSRLLAFSNTGSNKSKRSSSRVTHIKFTNQTLQRFC
ncbi:isoaspartyl peptidase/L-asparaginase isoform X2 [Macaca fascicularis]|uniref:isoaspartyl peptidase/L-asparaginase isoform X2 n=1 Tax=Macaca fascicularis TaxID=9541 RepID=UPI003D155E63